MIEAKCRENVEPVIYKTEIDGYIFKQLMHEVLSQEHLKL